LWGEGKELARFTALAQRESELTLPDDLDGHPLPKAPKTPAQSTIARMPFGRRRTGYADLVENRIVSGTFFQGRCAAWFRLQRPLADDEAPSGYQRVAVAADSGNGISSVLDWGRFIFVNADLTINLLRRPVGEWICVDARTLLAPNGCGLAESQLFDEAGLIGRATQSLAVRARG
jgi:acyl-CoA thioesterase